MWNSYYKFVRYHFRLTLYLLSHVTQYIINSLKYQRPPVKLGSNRKGRWVWTVVLWIYIFLVLFVVVSNLTLHIDTWTGFVHYKTAFFILLLRTNFNLCNVISLLTGGIFYNNIPKKCMYLPYFIRFYYSFICVRVIF